MGWNDAQLTVGAQAMQDNATHASLHTAQPDGTGSNETTAGRLAIDWVEPAAVGDAVLDSALAFTGGAASGPATHIGFWTGLAGSWLGWFPLTGDLAFNAAGELTVAAGTVLGSSTP